MRHMMEMTGSFLFCQILEHFRGSLVPIVGVRSRTETVFPRISEDILLLDHILTLDIQRQTVVMIVHVEAHLVVPELLREAFILKKKGAV